MENVSNILHNIIVQTFSAIKTNEEETRRKGKYTRINIISIGAVLSTLLLVLIAREIYQHPHIHEINGRRQLSGGTSDEDNAFMPSDKKSIESSSTQVTACGLLVCGCKTTNKTSCMKSDGCIIPSIALSKSGRKENSCCAVCGFFFLRYCFLFFLIPCNSLPPILNNLGYHKWSFVYIRLNTLQLTKLVCLGICYVSFLLSLSIIMSFPESHRSLFILSPVSVLRV